MAEKTKLCKHCGEEIPKSTNVCPKCGKKNSGANGCLIVIGAGLVFLTLSAIGSSMGSSSSGSSSSSEISTPTSSTAENSTPAKRYQTLQQAHESIDDLLFDISNDTIAFMDKHPDFFPAEIGVSEDFMPYVDFDIEYKHIMKSPDNYDDKLMYVTGKVDYIEEFPGENLNMSTPVTLATFYDENGNYYYLIYFNSVKVFEEDDIEVVGLSLGPSSFKNRMGGSTPCVVIAGVQATQLYPY